MLKRIGHPQTYPKTMAKQKENIKGRKLGTLGGRKYMVRILMNTKDFPSLQEFYIMFEAGNKHYKNLMWF